MIRTQTSLMKRAARRKSLYNAVEKRGNMDRMLPKRIGETNLQWLRRMHNDLCTSLSLPPKRAPFLAKEARTQLKWCEKHLVVAVTKELTQ